MYSTWLAGGMAVGGRQPTLAYEAVQLKWAEREVQQAHLDALRVSSVSGEFPSAWSDWRMPTTGIGAQPAPSCQHWWREPFVLTRPSPDGNARDEPGGVDLIPPLEGLLNRTLAVHVDAESTTFHPASRANDARRMSLLRALGALRRNPSAPAYALVALEEWQWRLLLGVFGLSEPRCLATASLPERECEGALEPANASWPFQRALRWRMLALGGAPGAGMPMHVDEPPTPSWHVQVRGRKRWVLCPPGLAADESGGRCQEATLRPGDSIFYPEGWAHETSTLDHGAASLSRSLITPGSAAVFAPAMRRWCDAALALDSHARLCAALSPCLRRLARVRDVARGSPQGTRRPGTDF